MANGGRPSRSYLFVDDHTTQPSFSRDKTVRKVDFRFPALLNASLVQLVPLLPAVFVHGPVARAHEGPFEKRGVLPGTDLQGGPPQSRSRSARRRPPVPLRS